MPLIAVPIASPALDDVPTDEGTPLSIAVRSESSAIVDETSVGARGRAEITREARIVARRSERAATEAMVFDTYRRFGIR